MRLAIVGSGPAAIGVLSAIEKRAPGADVHLFECGEPPPFPQPNPFATAGDFYADIYRRLARQGHTIPPEKTLFTRRLEKLHADNGRSLIVSQFEGGLSNFWGGLMQPLDAEDFSGWPIDLNDMQPHYRAIAKLIGLAGEDDLATMGPVKQLAGFARLQRRINSSQQVTAHTPLLAVRNDRGRHSCCYCGECMAGCFRDAVYRANHSLEIFGKTLRLQIRRKKILSYKNTADSVELLLDPSTTEQFDRVYLCAGVLGTTEIVMRSKDMQSIQGLQDNAIFQFPILNMSNVSDNAKDKYLALTNLLIDIKDHTDPVNSVKIQCYPNLDYLWRAMLPRWLWFLAKSSVKWSRDRLIWARLYLHGNISPQFKIVLKQDGLNLAEQGEADIRVMRNSLAILKNALKGSAFFIPRVAPIVAGTSAHLAATFPYVSATTAASSVTTAANSEVDKNVLICDASCFPSSATASPTLTVMANARRVTIMSLSK